MYLALRVCHLGLLLLLTLLPVTSRAVVCLPCDESKCEEPKNCPGSIVLGICGCCFMCARQKIESCGGVYGLHGACDRGLRCVIRPPLNGHSITEYEVGVCEGTVTPPQKPLHHACHIGGGVTSFITIHHHSSPFITLIHQDDLGYRK